MSSRKAWSIGFRPNFDTYPLPGIMLRLDASSDSSTFKVRKLFAAANWSGGVLRYTERWLLNFGVALVNCPIYFINIEFCEVPSRMKTSLNRLTVLEGYINQIAVVIPVPFQNWCDCGEFQSPLLDFRMKIWNFLLVIRPCLGKLFCHSIEIVINTGKLDWGRLRLSVLKFSKFIHAHKHQPQPEDR